MGSVTLKQVAQQAGVSISTASRVLNDQETQVPISEGTRERVLQAARELGYVPSAAARALRKGSSRTIGVLGNSPEDFVRAVGAEGFNSDLMRALMDEAARARLHLLLLTGASEEDGSYNTQVAELGMVEGLLVYNRDLSRGASYMEAVTGSGKPLVFLLEYPERDDIHVCAPDDAQGGRLATEKLLALGHQRIGFLTEPSYYPGVFGRRQAGWAQALGAAGITPAPSWVVHLSSIDLATFKDAGLTALVSPNDWMAQIFRTGTARALGLSVPKDISMVTFTYNQAAGPLACVATPLAPIVTRAVAMLSALIAGDPVPERLFTPPFSFLAGESLGPPRSQAGLAIR